MRKRDLSGHPIASVSIPRFVLTVMSRPGLRSAALYCVRNAARDFFGVQWRERFGPRLSCVSSVDHELDQLVPFAPGYINTYMDFIPFWIRTAAWLQRHYGLAGTAETAAFVRGIADLYRYAGSVYWARLSTTRRPFYVKRPRFALIHLSDPHFACVPSLHVMIVVYTWLAFRDLVRKLGDETSLAPRVQELFRGAMAITESILYVKQHSVNCISAALYVMCTLFPDWFDQAGAEAFIDQLFLTQPIPLAADAAVIRAHVLQLFRRFMAERQGHPDWRRPLLAFLASLPQRPGLRHDTERLLARVPRHGGKAPE